MDLPDRVALVTAVSGVERAYGTATHLVDGHFPEDHGVGAAEGASP
jgi:hypothetical protein